MPETMRFPKPNRVADDFVNRGLVSQEPAETGAPATQGPISPVPVTDPTKTTISYRHKLDNKRKITWLAERLGRPVGDLLDEALEAKFPEWRAQAATRSDVDPFTS
jgi:hypothetical protein